MQSSAEEAIRRLDESTTSSFQLKMVITAGMGFFTDAYDLFVIGVVSSILQRVWHINAFQVGLLSAIALTSAALGAVIFGRKFIYGAAGICVAGFALTFLLPEPKQKSLETIEKEGEEMDREARHPDAASA
jgi:hypothetical protein